MRRIASLVAVLAVAFTAACSADRSTSSLLTDSGSEMGRRNSGTSAPCLTPGAIDTLLVAVFETGSPDLNAARGRWENIQFQAGKGNTTEVTNKTIDLIDFMMDKQREGKLATTTAVAAQLSALIEGLACFGSVPLDYPEGATGDYLDPLDLDRIIIANSKQAGAFIPGGAVSAKSFFVIVPTSVPMATDLDKYPTNFDFAIYPKENLKEGIELTLGVCAITPTEGTLQRLQLGHNSISGFELLEPREVDFLGLQCLPPQPPATTSVVDRVLSAVLPKKLYAAMFFGVGGVGGSASELSPFGPVDPRVIVKKNVAGADAPIGGFVEPAPSVTLSTPLGTQLTDFPVSFTSNGGSILPGEVNSTAGVAASDSWQLPMTPGEYTATATPLVGKGAAVEYVRYVDESYEPLTSIRFTANALPPVKAVVTQAPETGSSFIAGAAHTPTTKVEVRDARDRLVTSYTGAVSMQAAAGAQTISGTPSVDAIGGIATFSNLRITKAGSFTMSPLVVFNNSSLDTLGTYAVVINPAAGIITKVAPFIADTVTVGTQTARVKVVDEFNNPLKDSTVFWQAFGSSAPATSVVDGNGLSSVTWTLQEGPNTLLAALDTPVSSDTTRSKDFNTYYKLPRQSTTLLACGLGTTRADLAPHRFRFTTLPGGKMSPARIDSMKIFLSVTGDASVPRLYSLRLIADEVLNGVVMRTDTAFANALLKGNAAQDAPATFVFPGGYRPTASSNVQLRVEKVPVNGVVLAGNLRFNEGSCKSTQLVPFRTDTTKPALAIAYQISTTN